MIADRCGIAGIKPPDAGVAELQARLVEVCRDLFGLRISEGGIDHALRRLAERARPTYEAIGAQGRTGPVP